MTSPLAALSASTINAMKEGLVTLNDQINVQHREEEKLQDQVDSILADKQEITDARQVNETTRRDMAALLAGCYTERIRYSVNPCEEPHHGETGHHWDVYDMFPGGMSVVTEGTEQAAKDQQLIMEATRPDHPRHEIETAEYWLALGWLR